MQLQTILTYVVVLVATTVYCHEHKRCSDFYEDADFKEYYDGCQFEMHEDCMTVKSCPNVCFNKANRSMRVGQRWKELNNMVKCKCQHQSGRPTLPPDEVPYPPKATCTLKTGCKHPMTGEYVKKMEKIMHKGHSCTCVKGPDTSDPYLKTFWHLECIAPIYARCKVIPNPSGAPYAITGALDFKQSPMGHTHIKYDIRDFDTTDKHIKHGFHVHTYGDIMEGCENTAGHYNPTSTTHGAREDHGRRHVGALGDLGNMVENEDGVASAMFENNLIKLTGPTSVMGRSVVIHVGEDLGHGGDHGSLITGNAGDRLACCVIFATDGQYWDMSPTTVPSPHDHDHDHDHDP